MVTKLRRFSTNSFIKALAFVLFIITVTTVVVQTQFYTNRQINPECLFVMEYKDSEEFMINYANNAISEVSFAIISNGQKLPKSSYYYYYITDGEQEYSNVQNADKNHFVQFDNAFFCYEKGVWSFGSNTNKRQTFRPFRFTKDIKDKYIVYLAFTNEFIESKQQEWDISIKKIKPIIISYILMFIAALFLIIFLIAVTGRKPEDMDLHLLKIDIIYSEILAFAILASPILLINIMLKSMQESTNLAGELELSHVLIMIMLGLYAVAASTIFCFSLLSIVRKIKAKNLIKHSIIYTLSFIIYDIFKSFFDGRKFKRYSLTKSLFYRQLLFITLSAILMFITIILIIKHSAFIWPLALESIIVYWYVKGNNKTFEDINKGFNESIEEQIKAERMKIDLVTNVSHDLKTPLTSIISYVDLLSRDENLSENAKDYVKILTEKSNRLKNIVSDLFDLAKSTSGNMTLEMEKINIKKLIEQTLGDMEDRIEKSGLQIKTTFPEKPVNIMSDGKKLYRVFQNVIDNALKYSLKGTRIFVTLEEENGKVVTVIKNTAGYEMNFTEDEILQRFNRGDKSRTTEGNGLGLSIAESFTNACGGSFKIKIDGDLFKVLISFNESEKELNANFQEALEEESIARPKYIKLLKKALKIIHDS